MTWRDKLTDVVSDVQAKTLVKSVELAQKRGEQIKEQEKVKRRIEVKTLDDLTVHFGVSEGPRTLLHLIKNHPDPEVVPQKLKDILTPWLEQYDHAYHHYLGDRFGEEILPVADALSESILLAQAQALGHAQHVQENEAEQQEISDLERHFNTDADE